MNKSEMKQTLATNLCEVTFTKTNGETRVMTCTLDPARIPSDQLPKTETEDKHETQVRVFDTKADGWRSFLSTNVSNFVVL